jgi:hypothetical protein
VSNWVGWLALATVAAVWFYLAHRFRPRCERHNEPVSIDRLASLGCKKCIDEDAATFWEKKRAEEASERRQAVRDVLSDDELMAQFCQRLKEFCEGPAAAAEKELDAAAAEGRLPGRVSNPDARDGL